MSKGYIRRLCSKCGEGLGFSESDPCTKCEAEQPQTIEVEAEGGKSGRMEPKPLLVDEAQPSEAWDIIATRVKAEASASIPRSRVDKGSTLSVAEIKALRAKITPGPWVYMTDETFGGEIRSCGATDDDLTSFSHIADTPEGDDRPDDMEFIARCPEIVDFLLAEIDRGSASSGERVVDPEEVSQPEPDRPPCVQVVQDYLNLTGKEWAKKYGVIYTHGGLISTLIMEHIRATSTPERVEEPSLAEYQAEYERLFNWRSLWNQLSNSKRFTLAVQNERIEAKAARANRLIAKLITEYDASPPSPSSPSGAMDGPDKLWAVIGENGSVWATFDAPDKASRYPGPRMLETASRQIVPYVRFDLTVDLRYTSPATAEWKPIESAPKDGSKVLIFVGSDDDGDCYKIACWSNPAARPGWFYRGGWLEESEPDGWIPMPAPPATTQSVEEESK